MRPRLAVAAIGTVTAILAPITLRALLSLRALRAHVPRGATFAGRPGLSLRALLAALALLSGFTLQSDLALRPLFPALAGLSLRALLAALALLSGFTLQSDLALRPLFPALAGRSGLSLLALRAGIACGPALSRRPRFSLRATLPRSAVAPIDTVPNRCDPLLRLSEQVANSFSLLRQERPMLRHERAMLGGAQLLVTSGVALHGGDGARDRIRRGFSEG